MNSTLEVYKIKIKDSYTFTSFANEKWKEEAEATLDDSAAFERIYKKLLDELVGEGVWQSERSPKKGLAVMNISSGDSINEILKSHSSSFVIEGFVDAGMFDLKRKMATYTDMKNKEELPREKIITDSFYFYLYIRMDSNKAILMIEDKKGAHMRSVFIEFVKNLFKIPHKCLCKLEPFMSKSFKENFKNKSVLKSVTCSSEVSSAVSLNGQTVDEQFKITVKVEPLKLYPVQNSSSVIDSIMKMAISLGDRVRSLNLFENQKGEMHNQEQNTSRTFNLSEPDVIPKLLLSDDMYDEDNSVLFRDKVFKKCNDLLQTIKSEIYPIIETNQENSNAD